MNERSLQVTYVPIDTLRPAERNPRTHSKAQLRQIAASVETFGFNNPLLVDHENRVVAGHGRLAAAKELGLTDLPTLRIEHLSEAQLRAYALADNQIATQAGWDEALLAVELNYIAELEIELDLTATGFSAGEIDVMLAVLDDESAPEPPPPVVNDTDPPVSRAGDLWLLGNHRLYCGDATQPAAYAALLGDDRAQMVFTDPPYNVRIHGHVSGLGAVQHREFEMASGEMSVDEFTQFLQASFEQMAEASCDGAIHFVCMDWRHLHELLCASQAAFTELKNVCVWNKNNGGMGSLYRSKHELVFVFKSGRAAHINNVELGKHGRYRTNVWDYPGVNTFRDGRDDELAMHPTVKPVALVADAIRDCSNRGGIVLDPFGGSGTTLIAAELTGRRGYLLELDPRYVDVICKRFHAQIEKYAVHAETGLTFAEVADERRDAVDGEVDTDG